MVKKKLGIIMPVLLLAYFLSGCSSRELTKYADDNSCLTTLEGNYYKETGANCDHPAVFLKMPRNPKLMEGNIVSVDSSGILFDPDKVGFYDEDETHYSYDTLYGVIDAKGKLIYGNIPDYYAVSQRLVVELEKSETKKISELVLQPNEPFSYCIEPGQYKITGLKFIDKKDVQDIGTDFPVVSFSIEAGKANYMGNIYADYKTRDETNVLVIPCSKYDGDAQAGAGMFGLIGSLAYAVANEIENADLHHVIHIELDKKFLPEANKSIVEINLEIAAP